MWSVFIYLAWQRNVLGGRYKRIIFNKDGSFLHMAIGIFWFMRFQVSFMFGQDSVLMDISVYELNFARPELIELGMTEVDVRLKKEAERAGKSKKSELLNI